MCLSLHTLLEACAEVSHRHTLSILKLVDILLFVLGLEVDVSHRAALSSCCLSCLFVCFKGRNGCRTHPLCLTNQIRICRVPQGTAMHDSCLRHSPNDDSQTRTHNPFSHHRNDTYQEGCELPSELCRLMYLHIWYAYLVLFTWFFLQVQAI